MKKIFLLNFVGILTLISCGSTGSSSLADNIHTVEFYDDSPTPQLVGYSYVIHGRSALDSFHDATENGYDRLSRCGSRPEKPGDYYSFSSWKGSYEDGTAVDISSIKEDCKVYATFETLSYTIGISLQDRGEYFKDEEGKQYATALHYGEMFDDEFLLPGEKEDEALYGEKDTFIGYQVSFGYGSKIDTPVFKDSSHFHWKAGEEVADVSFLEEGDLYVQIPPIEEENPTSYPISYCYGDGVQQIAEFGKNTFITLSTVYESEVASFPVYLYEDSTRSKLLDVFYVPYMDAITCEIIEGTTVISSESGELYRIEGNYSLEGIYVSEGEAIPNEPEKVFRAYYDIAPQYQGLSVDFNHIMGACYAYLQPNQ